jgi:flavin-dependent dehydrogenase
MPDIVIVGAGPAGSALAIQMARAGADVFLLDRSSFPRDKTCGDGLTPRAVAALDRLGILDDLELLNLKRVTGALLRSPSGYVWRMAFADSGFDIPPFGLTVPRYQFDDFLAKQAISAGALFQPGLEATGLCIKDGQVVGITAVRDNLEQKICSKLTAVATGARTKLLRHLKLIDRAPSASIAVRGYYSGVTDLQDILEFYFLILKSKNIAPSE